MKETYVLMSPRSIQREPVLRLHESAMDGFKYEDEKDGFKHQMTSD
jgi:hypothetical protein